VHTKTHTSPVCCCHGHCAAQCPEHACSHGWCVPAGQLFSKHMPASSDSMAKQRVFQSANGSASATVPVPQMQTSAVHGTEHLRTSCAPRSARWGYDRSCVPEGWLSQLRSAHMVAKKHLHGWRLLRISSTISFAFACPSLLTHWQASRS
jgi:hypothetical protein